MRHDNFITQPRFVAIRTRGRIPHWQVDEAIYFVTFSLRDAVPVAAVRAIFQERENTMRSAQNSVERERIDRALGLRFDQHFDEGGGSCLLRDHAELVANALKFFDRTRYELHAWCVMPNHVHTMLYLSLGAELPGIIHSWKSYIAHEINRGVIWQREYFDRIVRSPREFNETRAYIRANPSKAGLPDWPWVG